MSGWQTIRLGFACEKIGSGATPRGGSEVYQATGISLIRSQNIYNDGFKRDGLAFIGDKHARELENINVQGDSVARVCQVPDKILPARVNQHVAIIRPRQGTLDARFLHYFLIHPQTQAHMLSLAGAGATRNALTKGMIESFEIKAPSFSEQRAIAAVLGSLDDKIELNRRMNETLEALAQSLFKSWFVDTTQSALPKGWRETTIGELCEFAYMAYMSKEVLPPADVQEAFDKQVRPLFERVHHNDEESRTLAALRDALLPKLLSGELRVVAGMDSVDRMDA